MIEVISGGAFRRLTYLGEKEGGECRRYAYPNRCASFYLAFESITPAMRPYADWRNRSGEIGNVSIQVVASGGLNLYKRWIYLDQNVFILPPEVLRVIQALTPPGDLYADPASEGMEIHLRCPVSAAPVFFAYPLRFP